MARRPLLVLSALSLAGCAMHPVATAPLTAPSGLDRVWIHTLGLE
jgi:hypothetical protein